MEPSRKYDFTWDLLGDIAKGRPRLGPQTRIEVYRLMQFCFRDVIEKFYGTEAVETIFYKAGHLAGQQFYRNLLAPVHDPEEFIRKLQDLFKELQIGILCVEEADAVQGRYVITVAEDLECSGLLDKGFEVCTYDEGFMCAILEEFYGRRFTVKEVDCWCVGDRTCRFIAQAD